MEKSGKKEFLCDGKKCLAVRGNVVEVYWGNIKPGQDLSGYSQYDSIFSGHSHQPHFLKSIMIQKT